MYQDAATKLKLIKRKTPIPHFRILVFLDDFWLMLDTMLLLFQYTFFLASPSGIHSF